jgi:hypothetical protein
MGSASYNYFASRLKYNNVMLLTAIGMEAE